MYAAIDVRGLWKQFSRNRADRPATLQEAIIGGLTRLWPSEHFWVLRDVTFSVPPGEMIGIVGPNGAGKSTLLRLIGGVGRPDSGSIAVEGRIAALLDLGVGFHPDLTGRENVYVSGVITGLTRREVEKRFDSIVAFAELEAFIDSPLRTYSSGMQMRLAFAVAVHVEPEILFIDEVLSVGDFAFQEKCRDRITEFRYRGCTVVLVSHELDFVEQYCDRVLWLRSGEVMAYGDPIDVVGAYRSDSIAGSHTTAGSNTTDMRQTSSHGVAFTSAPSTSPHEAGT